MQVYGPAIPLVPSSQSAGGEVHGDLAMTAPGSQPVSSPSPEDPGQAAETISALAANGQDQTGRYSRVVRTPDSHFEGNWNGDVYHAGPGGWGR